MGYLERNNPVGAADVYRRGLLAGTWTRDDSRRILAMQDDQTELMRLITEANRDQGVAAALQRLLAAPRPARIRPADPREPADRTDGLGYNPYRSHGKFAPGAHKERPHGEGQEHASSAKPAARRARAAADAPAKAPHAPAALGALREAKAAAALARARPTEANIAAARAAVGKAAAASTRPARPTVVQDPQQSSPRHPFATEHNADTTNGRSDRQLTPGAQAALRSHLDATIARYGMASRDTGLPEAHAVEVRTDHFMGGAGAQHYPETGKVVLNESSALQLLNHGAHDPLELGHRLRSEDREAERMVEAHRLVTHEAVHGHGPSNTYDKHGIMLEELATEMSARKITADAHGLSVWDARTVGSYTHYVSPTISTLSEVSGRSRADAHEALAQASLEYKRGTGHTADPSTALRELGASALRHLGVHNDAHVATMHQSMLETSGGV